MNIENNKFILDTEDSYFNDYGFTTNFDPVKDLFIKHFPPKNHIMTITVHQVKSAIRSIQKKDKRTIEELIFVGELFLIQDVLDNKKDNIEKVNRNRLIVMANAFFLTKENYQGRELPNLFQKNKFNFKIAKKAEDLLESIIDLIQAATQMLTKDLKAERLPEQETPVFTPVQFPYTSNSKDTKKNEFQTKEQKVAASKERVAKMKEERKAKRQGQNSVPETKQKEPEKNFLENAFNSLVSYATKIISLDYNSKKDKYFNQKDTHTLSLVRSTVGAKDTKSGIAADIAKSKYPRQLTTRQITNIVDILTDLDQKQEKVTWGQIFTRLQEHKNNQNLTNSKVGKLARKVDVINNYAKENLSDSKDQITALIEEKATVSKEIAKLSVAIRSTSKNLGFFGWILHPMQSYRNSCAKDLLKELRNSQHQGRQIRKQLDPQAWRLALYKYLYIGEEALKQPGDNDDARRLLQKSFNELQRFDKALKDLGTKKIDTKLIRSINKTIDELMDAEARLKMEISIRPSK